MSQARSHVVHPLLLAALALLFGVALPVLAQSDVPPIPLKTVKAPDRLDVESVVTFEVLPPVSGTTPEQLTHWTDVVLELYLSAEPIALARQAELRGELDAVDPVDALPAYLNALRGLDLAEPTAQRAFSELGRDWQERVEYVPMFSMPTTSKVWDERAIKLATQVVTAWERWWREHRASGSDPDLLADYRAKIDSKRRQREARGAQALARGDADWLIDEVSLPAQGVRGSHPDELILSNGLIARTFRRRPNLATVGLDHLVTGRSLVRAVKPEAELVINRRAIAVGGLVGQPDHAYLRDSWLDTMSSDPRAFQLEGFDFTAVAAPFAWKRVRHSEDRPWPPPGQGLRFDFNLTAEGAAALAAQDAEHVDGVDGVNGVNRADDGRDPAELAELAEDLLALEVSVHYELYDGLPVLAKWFTLHNGGTRPVRLDSFKNEILAVVEAESMVDSAARQRLPDLDLVSDYAFGGMDPKSSTQTTHWLPDPEYLTQVNYRRDAPLMVTSAPAVGPAVDVAPGETFTSFRTYLLVHDSTDRERQGLAMRCMWRTIAPWVTENPLMMHVRHADPDTVRAAIDQCAAVGFEMVILTFGSGFDIENEDPAYRAQLKALADYAHERGVELGGYSLLSSRRIGPETDVIDVETGEPGGAVFGNAPCLGSAWGIEHMQRLRRFFEQTGFDLLEHDGSYPGDFCASTTHPGHRGYADSQWTQWVAIRDFYRWCRERGIYLNVPDTYFLAGSNKTGMGYRETNWSLPRDQQVIHGRQNIYDGTWTKTPSMGWMFVPLTEYHGGGAAATLEPLAEHLDAYAAHLANNLTLGVQACYRGPRLFDTDATRDVVAQWVAMFKQHRAILESDVLHLRRADGRDLDFMLHVNPRLDERALLAVFNPLDEVVSRTLTVPLEHAGLTTTTRVRERDGEPVELTLDRRFGVQLPVEIGPHTVIWFVFEEG